MKTEMTTNINLIVKTILKLIILLKIFILLEKLKFLFYCQYLKSKSE